MDPTSGTNLASHYECPVCYDYIRPPIFQCQNGHSVCHNCSPKLECCPTCKGQLGVSRALFMEKMLDSILFPCKNSSKGCKTTLLLTEMDTQEENCAFPPYSCIFCQWKGAVGKIVTHFQLDHPTIKRMQGNKFTYSLENAKLVNSPMVDAWKIYCSQHIDCFGHHFLLLLLKKKKTNDKFVFFVTAILLTGSQDAASKFTCKIKLKGRQHKKMWESTPLSILDTPNIFPSSSICHASFSAIANYGSRLFDSNTSHLFLVNDEISFDIEIGQSSLS